MYRLLIVDDDIEVLDINKKYFEENGFSVLTYASADKAIKAIDKFKPDCILLDIMMPEINGYKACQLIRKRVNTPIIFLSGKISEDDKIKGLQIGGDDYIEKPYSLKELHARIIANIRRSHYSVLSDNSSIISYPPLSVDLAQHKAYFNENELLLSNREFELLMLLINNVNKLVNFEDIGNKMWGNYNESDRRSIMVNVSRLRKKIDSYGDSDMIETVWSKGYKFNYEKETIHKA